MGGDGGIGVLCLPSDSPVQPLYPQRGPLSQVGGNAGPHFFRGTIIQAAVYPHGIRMLNPLSDRRISRSEGGNGLAPAKLTQAISLAGVLTISRFFRNRSV